MNPKLIHHISSNPAAFGFWASFSPDKVILNPVNKRTVQCLAASVAHATLDMEQLISHARTVLVDLIASLQDSYGGVIAASEVHELHIKIHDFLDSALYKQVGNTAHFSTSFNSASRQCHEIWASHFPFFITLRIPFLLVKLTFMVTSTGL